MPGHIKYVNGCTRMDGLLGVDYNCCVIAIPRPTGNYIAKDKKHDKDIKAIYIGRPVNHVSRLLVFKNMFN